jgi:hypothetical protein
MIFGHQSSGQNSVVPQNQNDQVAPTNIDGVQQDSNAAAPDPLRIDPTSDMQAPTLDELEDSQPAPNVLNQPATEQTAPALEESPKEQATQTPAEEQPSPVVNAPNKDELLELKKQALGELSPLVDHLEQTPEEKFRTTMMLIQSTDNADLLKEAHTAAQTISDEKVRAQALLDIVNEINYFTHKTDEAA